MSGDLYYTPAQAARLLGCNPKTLNRWEADGKVPRAVRTLGGGHRRWLRSEIDPLVSPRVFEAVDPVEAAALADVAKVLGLGGGRC